MKRTEKAAAAENRSAGMSVQRKSKRFEMRLTTEELRQLRHLRYLLGVAARRDGIRRPRSFAECVMIAVKTLSLEIAKQTGEVLP